MGLLVDITRKGRGPWRFRQGFLTSRGKRRSIGWDVWQPMEGDPTGKKYYCVAARGLSTRGQAVAVAAALNAAERPRERVFSEALRARPT